MFLVEQSHVQGNPLRFILRMPALRDYRVAVRGYLTECSTMPATTEGRVEKCFENSFQTKLTIEIYSESNCK
jgi:hypothetical protein